MFVDEYLEWRKVFCVLVKSCISWSSDLLIFVVFQPVRHPVPRSRLASTDDLGKRASKLGAHGAVENEVGGQVGFRFGVGVGGVTGTGRSWCSRERSWGLGWV